MFVRYDKLKRLEKPVMTLCNPGTTYINGVLSGSIGCLFDTEAEEFVFNFNSVSELNFRVNRTPVDDDSAAHVFDMVKNRRLIFIDNIGFFVITNTDTKFENGVWYKDVQAESADTELKQRVLPYIADGTYRFSTQGTDIGIFDTIVSRIPLWNIGYIDSEVASRHRTFEDVETNQNCLSFMIERMQEAYECIILFDILNRTISVYDQNTYTELPGIQTDIHLSIDDIVNSVTITEGSEELYTALRAVGGENEDVLISLVNPTGENVVYNFTYYLGWMSDDLRGKIQQWTSDIESSEDDYRDLNETLSTKIDERSNLIDDARVLNENLRLCEKIKVNANTYANGDTIASRDTIVSEINSIQGIPQIYTPSISVDYESVDQLIDEVGRNITELTRKLSIIQTDIDNLNAEISDKRSDIEAIVSDLKLTDRLKPAEYDELQNFIFEGDYQDEYSLITDKMTNHEQFEQRAQMYDRVKKQLERIAEPTQEFDIDSEGFVFAEDFSSFAEQLQTGCIINIDLGDYNETPAMFFLSSITVNYDDKKLNLTIGNRYNKFDPRTLFENVLGSVSRSANTISYLKDVVYPLKAGELDDIELALQTSRNLTAENAIAATDQSIIIDSSGYIGRRSDGDGGFENEQIKIVNNGIVFTRDNWDSCSAAIGKITFPDPTNPGQDITTYGINADALVGKMILAQNVYVANEDSSVVIDNDGICVDARFTEQRDAANLITTIDPTSGTWYTDSTWQLGSDWRLYGATITTNNSNIGSAWVNWFSDGYDNDKNVYIGIDHENSNESRELYVLKKTQINPDGLEGEYLSFNIDNETGLVKDSNLPAFSIQRPVVTQVSILRRYSIRFWSTTEEPETYKLIEDVLTGSKTYINHEGVSTYEQEAYGNIDTSGSGIVDIFLRMFNKIRKMFPVAPVDDDAYNKVGVKVINDGDNNIAALSASDVMFQHVDVDSGGNVTGSKLSYYGLDGAETPRIKTGVLSADTIFSNTIQYGSGDKFVIQDANNAMQVGFPLSGYSTLGTATSAGRPTLLRIGVQVDKSLDFVDTITINKFWCGIRGINGYVGIKYKDVTNVLYGAINQNNIAAYRQEILDYNEILAEAEDIGVDFTRTVYGNIDTNNRQVLEWTAATVARFRTELESWLFDGESPEDFIGTISTVFGGYETFDDLDVAYSPILQTSNGPVLLHSDVVMDYIWALIDDLNANHSSWTTQDLLSADRTGKNIDGVQIKGLIAGAGSDAAFISEAMHYTGENGALNSSIPLITDLMDTYHVTFDQAVAYINDPNQITTYTPSYCSDWLTYTTTDNPTGVHLVDFNIRKEGDHMLTIDIVTATPAGDTGSLGFDNISNNTPISVDALDVEIEFSLSQE